MKKILQMALPVMVAAAVLGVTLVEAAPRMAASAASVVYYAAPNGSGTSCTLASPCTLNTGLGLLAPGDTLYLRGGAYGQLVSLSHSGAAGANISVAGYPGEVAVIDGSPVPSSYDNCTNILRISASYVTVRDLELYNPNGCGIRIPTGSNYDVLDTISIHDILGSGIYNMGNNNTIQNSRVWRVNMSNSCPAHDGCGHSYWSGGISWGDTTVPNTGLNTTVKNNVVHDTYGEGIMGMYTSGALVEGNVVYDNWALGIYAANSSSFVIRNNLIYYTMNKDYWRFGTSAPAAIMVADENQIPGQPNGHDRQIYNNIVVNAGYGFYFWTGEAPGAGLINDSIYNNTIIDNLAGVGIRIETGAHQNSAIANNLVKVGTAASPLVVSSTAGLTFTHNLWSTPPSTSGTGDVVANPQLANPDQSVDNGIDATWYKLTVNSPAIDAGTPVNLSSDYFGTSRPQGAGYDIGASEYGVAGLPTATSPAPTATLGLGATPQPMATAAASPTATATSVSGGTPSPVTYVSSADQDGYVVETSQTSGIGGTTNVSGSVFRLGDDPLNRQYRAILSFDTAGLPDNAVITSVVLKFKQAGSGGSNPYSSMGNIMADIISGPFSGSSALESSDFQAPANKKSAMSIANAPTNGVYSKAMSSTYFSYVNKTGLTQIRLRFATGDNKNGIADYLSFYTGEATTSANRPVLVITYTAP